MRLLLAEDDAMIGAAVERGLAQDGFVVDLVLDPAARRVTLRGAPVALSPRELALLEALMQRPGAVPSRAQLEERLYGWNDAVESNAVEVHLHGLRRKLGAEAIRNVRGVGWTLAPASR